LPILICFAYRSRIPVPVGPISWTSKLSAFSLISSTAFGHFLLFTICISLSLIYDVVSLNLCDIAVMMCVNHSASSQTTSVDASATSQSHHPPKDQRAGTQLELSFSYELQQGYRILRELTTDSNKSFVGPFLNPIDSSSPEYDEYHRRVKCPVWLKQSKLINML